MSKLKKTLNSVLIIMMCVTGFLNVRVKEVHAATYQVSKWSGIDDPQSLEYALSRGYNDIEIIEDLYIDKSLSISRTTTLRGSENKRIMLENAYIEKRYRYGSFQSTNFEEVSNIAYQNIRCNGNAYPENGGSPLSGSCRVDDNELEIFERVYGEYGENGRPVYAYEKAKKLIDEALETRAIETQQKEARSEILRDNPIYFVFEVISNAKLTLDRITIDGNNMKGCFRETDLNYNGTSSSVIFVNGGELVIENTAAIKNFNFIGSPVLLYNAGQLNLRGEISGNITINTETNSPYSELKNMISNSSYNFNDIKSGLLQKSTLIPNTAGAIYGKHNSKIFIHPESIISSNIGKTGAVVVDQSKLNMYGGRIEYNIGAIHSGGVNVENGAEFIMDDGIIQNNLSFNKGGGVWVTEWGNKGLVKRAREIDEFTEVETGEISNPDDRQQPGIFRLNGGDITQNTAILRGGGINIESDEVYLTKGNITNNTSFELGGGIYIEGDYVNDYYYKLLFPHGKVSIKNNTAVRGKELKYNFTSYTENINISEHNSIDFPYDRKGGGIWTCSWGTQFIYDPDLINLGYIKGNTIDDFYISPKGSYGLGQSFTVNEENGEFEFYEWYEYGKNFAKVGYNRTLNNNNGDLVISGNRAICGGGIANNGLLSFGSEPDENNFLYANITPCGDCESKVRVNYKNEETNFITPIHDESVELNATDSIMVPNNANSIDTSTDNDVTLFDVKCDGSIVDLSDKSKMLELVDNSEGCEVVSRVIVEKDNSEDNNEEIIEQTFTLEEVKDGGYMNDEENSRPARSFILKIKGDLSCETKNPDPEPEETPESKTKIKKYFVVNKDTEIPESEFSFTIRAGQGNDPAENSAVVYPGKNPELVKINGTAQSGKVKFNANEQTTDGALEGVATVDQKYAMKDIVLDFSDVVFDEVGIYRYVLIEEENESEAINNDVEPIRVIDVYVVNNDEGDGIKIGGYVGYYGEITEAPKLFPEFEYEYEDTDNNGEISQEEKDAQKEAYEEAYKAFIALIEDGSGKPSGSYVNAQEPLGVEAGEKSDKYVNTLQSANLILKKIVRGNQGSKDEYFKFTINLSKVGKGNVININANNFETSTHANNATPYSVNEMNSSNSRDDDKDNILYTQEEFDVYVAEHNENPTWAVGDIKKAARIDQQLIANENGEIEWIVYLHHGQSVELKGIPFEAEYSITETNSPGYTVLVENNNGVIQGNVNVEFINEKSGVIPTGVFMPIAGGVILVVIAGVGMLLSKKKKDDE